MEQSQLINFKFLIGELREKEDLIKWCMDQGLIASESKCSVCDGNMRLVVRNNTSDGYQWRCQLGGKGKHDVRKSLRKGSLFECSRLSMHDVLLLTYMWFVEDSNNRIMREMNVCLSTVMDWKSFCREVCVETMVNASVPLGGENVIVEFDESKFIKRKYNRGKNVEGTWVYGGIERGSSKCFLRVVADKSKDSLLQIIKENILPGTLIVSDCWNSYDCLEDEDFKQLKVNHSLQFIEPETGPHTNATKGTWSAIKNKMQGPNQCVEGFQSYLAEYVWRKAHQNDSNDLFLVFLQAVSKVYPPGTEDESL